jgi:hypothetical protein
VHSDNALGEFSHLQWVPRVLTAEQKQIRVQMAIELLQVLLVWNMARLFRDIFAWNSCLSLPEKVPTGIMKILTELCEILLRHFSGE